MFTLSQLLSHPKQYSENLAYFNFLFQLLFKSSDMEVDVNLRPKKKTKFAIKIFQFEMVKFESRENPKARSGHRMVSDGDGNLYILGGYNSDLIDDSDLENDEDWQQTKPIFKELWKFNITTRKWTKIKTNGEFPKQLASHCVEMLDGSYIVSYGGTAVPFEQNSSNKLYLCNLKTKQWSLLNPLCKIESEFPDKKYGQAICLDEKNSKIYVSGGTDGFQFCMDIHCFDFRNKLWTQLISPIDQSVQGRYRHEMTLYENRLYIFGGGSYNLDLDCGKILPVFDLQTLSWTECHTIGHTTEIPVSSAKYPSARRCHIICRYKDSILLLGGLFSKKIRQDLWQFNLKTKKWTLLVEKIPMPCYFHAASCSNVGELTFFGGICKPKTATRSDKMFSIWIDIPPLKEMAFRALCYYNDNFKDKSENELLNMGLRSFIRRLKD